MEKVKLSKSLRKYVRLQKARIRREVLDLAEQRERIDKLYSQFLPSEKSPGEQKKEKPKKKKEEKLEQKEKKPKKQVSSKTKKEAEETK